jgi:hypothetical protein
MSSCFSKSKQGVQLMSSAQLETPQIVGNLWSGLITGAAIGVVAGIGIGVIATSKDAIPTIAAGAAGLGAGSAIAYLVADHRHSDRRNGLIARLDGVTGDRAQLQQQLEQSSHTISQLQSELQAANARYNLLAEAAETELQRLQAATPADAVSPDSPIDTHTPIAPIELPPGLATELPATAESAMVSSFNLH